MRKPAKDLEMIDWNKADEISTEAEKVLCEFEDLLENSNNVDVNEDENLFAKLIWDFATAWAELDLFISDTIKKMKGG